MDSKTLITIPFEDGGIPVYMACPAGDEVRPGLILIHEVWGMADHIKNVADRLCQQGFEVIAPNLMAGTEVEKVARPELAAALFDPKSHPDKQVELRALFTPLQSPEFSDETVKKLQSCFRYLSDKQAGRKIGVIGFCFGGTYSFKLAIAQPGLAAAVPFYGHADHRDEEISKIKAPILAFYGELDTGLTDKLPALSAQMKKAGVDFTYKVYANARHAFFNDTNPVTYNEAAAKDAWQLALDFLSKQLR